jgi:integrase
MTPSSANRTAIALKAALNLAADHDGHIASRRAWKIGLASIPDATQSRNVILDEATIRHLISEAHALSAQFGLLVEVATVTGARISQIVRLEVQDLQADRVDPRLLMPSSRKGRGMKKISRRPVPIPPGLARRLNTLSDGRTLTAPLLTRQSGEAWKTTNQKRSFQRATKAAGLDPAEVTMYALRHSNIVRQLLAGVPIRVVAVNHDTSVVMIERTYSRYIGDHSDMLARAALLDTTALADSNAVPTRASAVVP